MRPLLVDHLWTWLTRYRYPLGLLAGVGLFVYLAWFDAPRSTPTLASPQAPALPPLQVKKAEQFKDFLATQRKTEEQAKEIQRLERTLTDMSKAQEQERRDRVSQEAQRQQQFEAKLRQEFDAMASKLQAEVRARPPVEARVAPAPTKTPVVSMAPPPSFPAPRPVGTLVILDADRSAGKEWKGTTPVLPDEVRQATAYLPAGCFAEGRVIFGAMASSQLTGQVGPGARGTPILFAVTNEFTCPWQLQGSARNSLPTAAPLQGCFMFGMAQADLAASRAVIGLDLLSCVLPDGSSFEPEIKGYVVDRDGTLGLYGRVITHDSAKVGKAFITGLIQEASAAFGLAKSSVVVTQGGGIQPFQGMQTTLQEIARYWLDQARALSPTLWVQPGIPARLVLQKGLTLEGLPTQILLAQGGR